MASAASPHLLSGAAVPLAAAASALGGLVFGYELGIVSGALLQLRRELRLSCLQQEALVSSLLAGALLASLLGGFLIDGRGRRRCILLSSGLVLGGSAALLLGSFPALLLGRMLVGFAVCMSSMSCCIYVSELVASERRGFLVTLYEAGLTVGVLAAYAVNYVLSEARGGWRWMFGLAAVPAVLQLLSIWFLPADAEASPGHRGGRSAAARQDRRLGARGGTGGGPFSLLYLCQSRDNMRTRTAVGLGLVLFQQLTGQPNVLLYASSILQSVGFRSAGAAALASLGLASVKVPATLAAALLSDRVGRRPLLLGGCSLMAAGLTLIGLLSRRSPGDWPTPCGARRLNETLRANLTALGSVLNHKPTAAEAAPPDWIVLLGMMAVVCAFAVGFGPMTWLLLSEIFPAEVRGRAFAFTNCFNWGAHLLVTCSFLNLVDAISLSGVFLLYGVTAAAATLFFYFLLPETRGKSLQSIDQELRFSGRSCSSCCSCSCCSCCSGCSDRDSSSQYQRVKYWQGSVE